MSRYTCCCPLDLLFSTRCMVNTVYRPLRDRDRLNEWIVCLWEALLYLVKPEHKLPVDPEKNSQLHVSGRLAPNVWRTLGYSHFKYKICSSTPDGNSRLDHDLSPRYYLIFQECSQFDKFSRTQNKREIMCNGFSWEVMINNDCWVIVLQNLSIDKLGGTSRHVHSESVVIQCPFSSLQPLRNFWLA
jgi:hypothetical protein